MIIVKNEVETLRGCVDAARPIIDSLTILDTGSTDGTQMIARELIKEIGRGHLTCSKAPWSGFGPARTNALQLARRSGSEYLLMLDADHRLRIDAGKKRRLANLSKDIYTIRVLGSMQWKLPLLTRAAHPCDYRGAAHSYLHSLAPATQGDLADVLAIEGGAAPSQEKIARDLPLLQAEVDREPNNARAVFYLAQTYRDLDRPVEAEATYLRRAAMGGWEEEVAWSLYQAALARSWRNFNEAVPMLLHAWDFRPARKEPLYVLARGLHAQGRLHAADHFARIGRELPPPTDKLFVLTWLDDTTVWDQFLVTA